MRWHLNGLETAGDAERLLWMVLRQHHIEQPRKVIFWDEANVARIDVKVFGFPESRSAPLGVKSFLVGFRGSHALFWG